jgi:hypothetical protein
VGALTPPGKVVGRRRRWLWGVAAYTLAGAISSTLVGLGLGALGSVVTSSFARPALAVCLGVAIAGFLREARIVPIPLPQLKRQTRDVWAKGNLAPVAAALWGLDLGLTFSSWMTFAGVWFVFAVSAASADPGFGAALLGAYWAGRASSVWVAPSLAPSVGATPELLLAISEEGRALRRVHAGALAAAALAAATFLAHP